jgi:hypothetical protein
MNYLAMFGDIGLSFLIGLVVAFAIIQYQSEHHVGFLGAKKRKLLFLGFSLLIIGHWSWFLWV